MTKIKILGDRIIFDGHADTQRECVTVTLLCDNLAKSVDFKTIKYESGYAEFEKIGSVKNVGDLMFPPAIGSLTVIFDSNITQVIIDAPNGTVTCTESGSSYDNSTYSFDNTLALPFTVTLNNGYILDNVTVTDDSGLGSVTITSDNTFTGNYICGGGDTTITITSKQGGASKQTIDVSTLNGWENLASGNHNVTVKTKASGYLDSASSNAVTVSKAAQLTLQYYGTATELSTARRYLAATNVGNYALFGGGYDSSNAVSATVDAYDTSLTRTIPTALSTARRYLAATNVGNYALFGGGSTTADVATVDAYDTSLTRTIPTALSYSKSKLSATSVGNYALFGGGTNALNIVDAYDTSLTRTLPTQMTQGGQEAAATNVGNYALFGGGTGSALYSTVNAYDTSLTRTIPTALSTARNLLSATSVGNYALFGGGKRGGYSTSYATVDAYDTSLTRTTPTALSTERYSLAATSVGNYALFGGGYGSKVVDAYDTSLTRTIPTALSVAWTSLAATSVGNYALFCHSATSSSKIDVYTVA